MSAYPRSRFLVAAVCGAIVAAGTCAYVNKQTMELENYGIEPVRLTEVRIEK